MTELGHIEAIEKELKQIETTNAWTEVYQKVRSEGNYDFPLSIARSALNRPLNRYRDVLPYDHSRIILQHPTTDYINASLVKVDSINRQYILTQGPLASTTQHFWLMVWQQQCKGIVMLNKIIEKNMIKCHQYWPIGENNNGKDCVEFPGVGLKVELVSEVKHHHYIYRTLRLTETSSGDSREVLHFHYTTWPDFGVPQAPEAFSKFLNIVIKSGCLEPSVGPAVVHCSAGIGRSGTFCLVDTLLQMLDRGMCSSNVGTVLEVLLDMRRYRMGLIQTPDQLRFSYQAIIHAVKQKMQKQLMNSGVANNGSLENGGAESDSSSDLDDAIDEPPPRPPPRTDSLTRSMIEAQLEDGSGGDEGEESEDDDSQVNPVDLGSNVLHDSLPESKRELPPTPASPKESEDTPPPPPPRGSLQVTAEEKGQEPTTKQTEANGVPATTPEELASQMATEIRRRRHQARNSSIAAKVSAMKEKKESIEKWEQRKRPTEAVAGPSKKKRH